MQDELLIDLQEQIKDLQQRILILEKKLSETANTKPVIDYSTYPGEEGVFDGFNMVTSDGNSIPVPSNYSAKTKILFGDKLKLIEEDGKKIFKHIDKVPRQKVEAILTKKEGSWYALTELGTYKVSDTAVEFQGAQLNSKATILIPADNPKVSFATLDQVEGFGPKLLATNPKKSPVVKAKKDKTTVVAPKVPSQKSATPAPLSTQPVPREKTSSILDDDLV